MQKMINRETARKPYRRPTLSYYEDIRTITMGASVFPGESGGYEENPNPADAPVDKGTGSTNDIFE